MKKAIAKLIIKLSPLRWAWQQLNCSDVYFEENKEAIYKAVESAMADRGEQWPR